VWLVVFVLGKGKYQIRERDECCVDDSAAAGGF
jgi:hypothetical protein